MTLKQLTLKQLIKKHDSLVLPEYEIGLGDVGDLQDALNEEDYLILPADMTKSGKEEIINFKDPLNQAGTWPVVPNVTKE